MEAKELRIGNLVFYRKEIYEIDAISKSHIYLTNGENLIKTTIECLSPIPLTEELLLNFGFTKIDREDEDFTYFKKGNIEFTDVSPNGIELVWYELSPCISIHQLQNLYFALTGEELETKQDTTPTQRAALDEKFSNMENQKIHIQSRRSGKTTRTIDNAIQSLFEGKKLFFPSKNSIRKAWDTMHIYSLKTSLFDVNFEKKTGMIAIMDSDGLDGHAQHIMLKKFLVRLEIEHNLIYTPIEENSPNTTISITDFKPKN